LTYTGTQDDNTVFFVSVHYNARGVGLRQYARSVEKEGVQVEHAIVELDDDDNVVTSYTQTDGGPYTVTARDCGYDTVISLIYHGETLFPDDPFIATRDDETADWSFHPD
jgi:hypothetical protein